MNKLDKLNKQQKLELLELLEKKKQARRESRPLYAPHAKQLLIHRSSALQRFLLSANGFGKTTLLVNEVHWAATGYNPITEKYTHVPSVIYVVLDKPEKVDEVILPAYKKWFALKPEQLHKNGKPYISSITYDNGSVVRFIFHEQGELTAESIELDYIFADEPMPRYLYVALRRGGRKKSGIAKVLMAGTVLNAPWLWADIYEPWRNGELKDVECFGGTTYDNEKNLGTGYIENFSSTLTEKERAVRLRGERFDLEGGALVDVWDRKAHVVEDFAWGRDNPCVIAIDPHMSKPHHAVLMGVNRDNQLFVIAEMAQRVPAATFAESLLLKWINRYTVIDIVCDSLGSTPQTGGEGFLSFIQVLKKEGIKLRSTTYEDKSEEDWIDRIKSSLIIPTSGIPRLRVFKGCIGLVKDIETVQWQKVRHEEIYKPKLEISNKDYLSCLKYALSTDLSVEKASRKPYNPERPPTSYGQRESKWARMRRQHQTLKLPIKLGR